MIVYLIFPSPGYVTAAKSVQKKIKLSIGEEPLRSWAMSVVDKYRNQAEQTGKYEYPKSEVPTWLTNLGDPFPLSGGSVFVPRGGKEYITVVWLTGRGGIGLEIGPTNFVELQMNSELYWITVSPGIYIFTSVN